LRLRRYQIQAELWIYGYYRAEVWQQQRLSGSIMKIETKEDDDCQWNENCVNLEVGDIKFRLTWFFWREFQRTLVTWLICLFSSYFWYKFILWPSLVGE
jgi:hypothetical protein